MSKMILVIDDDIGMLRALTKVLTSEGYAVAGASDSAAAMSYVLDEHQTFDLVITDIRMPLLDGLEVLDLVKTNRPRVPVIVITAFGDSVTFARAQQLGAAAYLEKPVDTPHLLHAIEHALAALA